MSEPPRDNPRRIVVKIGSAVVVTEGQLDRTRVDRLAAEVGALLDAGGVEVVVVSSGAVAGGASLLGLGEMPTSILDKQAAAAIGQQRLMRAWGEALAEAGGRTAAQVLLTSDDLEHRARFLNARHTLERLLEAGVVPIVNENDSVSFDEIKLGDNDRLGALVAVALDADLLVVLSSVEGLLDEGGRVVGLVEDLDAAGALVRDDRSSTGVGGMTTKLDAVRIVADSGIDAVLAPGARRGALLDAVEGRAVGTRIPARATSPNARKSWIAHSHRPKGSITIDAGAVSALRDRGASLLPKGVTGLEGAFEMGAVIEIVDAGGASIARGLASYSARDIRRIMGRRGDEIESILGYRYDDAIVHRDDLALTPRVRPEPST
ncbi:MAG: glutamate 5-kinase [Planctomycetota bacterium]